MFKKRSVLVLKMSKNDMIIMKKIIKNNVQTSVDVSHVVTHHSTKSPQNRLTSQFGMGYGVFDSV